MYTASPPFKHIATNDIDERFMSHFMAMLPLRCEHHCGSARSRIKALNKGIVSVHNDVFVWKVEANIH